MTANPVWIASQGGPPPVAIGASPVWVAPNDGSVPAAAQVWIAAYGGPAAGASPVWIAAYGGPPPAGIGATPICIGGGSGGGSGATGHRYWRINITATVDGAYAAFAEIQFRTAAGVSLPFSGGTAIADSSYPGFPISNGSDGNTANPWITGVALPLPHWWGYDYGSGHALDIKEIVITARIDANFNQTPAVFTPQWSDDGSTWNSMAQVTTATWTALGQVQTFGVTPASTSSVWSASDASANAMTLSNGGLTLNVPASGSGFFIVRNTLSRTSGKLYIEVLVPAASGEANFHIGLASSGVNIGSYLGNSNYSFGYSPIYGNVFASTGFSGLTTIPPPGVPSVNDVYGVAVDFTTGMVWSSYNNIWLASGNPVTEANPLQSFVPATVGALFFAISHDLPGPSTWTLQPTAASQKYAPPAGFAAWG